MSPKETKYEVQEEGFPRVSGDEPKTGIAATAIIMFSPRERG